MIRGIHYFSAKVKTKLMSSQGAALSQCKNKICETVPTTAPGRDFLIHHFLDTLLYVYSISAS